MFPFLSLLSFFHHPSEMNMDLDLDNNPEFMEFMKKNNVNADVFEYIKAQLEPYHNSMVEQMNLATQMALQKAQEDAINGNMYDNENQPPASNADAPSTSIKAAGRAFTGQAPSTVAKPSSVAADLGATKKKAPRTTRDRSSALKSSKKTTTTASADGDLEVPKGEVRLEVISSTSARNIVGTFKFVKPQPESTKNKGQHAKIGRSTGEEYKKYGFSIKDDEVSTAHAIIFRKGTKFYWKDKHSTNGSVANYGNGEREHMISGELYQMRDGMKVELGECIIKINFSSG